MEKMMTYILICIGIGLAGCITYLLYMERRKVCIRQVENIEDSNHTVIEGKGIVDYNIYVMTMKERVLNVFIAAIVIFIIGYIFYRNSIIAIILTPIALLYPKKHTQWIIQNRKNKLILQFRDALYAISSSMSAGKSIEWALQDAINDLTIFYSDPETLIIKELKYMVWRIEMNESVESVLNDFASRTHIDDIQSFADVFQISKRSGANIIAVMKNTSDMISDKIMVRQEIDTLLTEKKLEQKVLMVMPIFMIWLLSISSGDFMEPVFTHLIGKIVMTIAIILFIVAYLIAEKIMNIDI